PLMPSDAGARADVRLWTYWCGQFFKPDVDRLKYGVARFPQEECEEIENKVIGHLEKIEKQLATSGWLVGGSFSLADIHVFPFFRQLSKITPTPEFVARFPRAQQWLTRITSRSAFEKTMNR